MKLHLYILSLFVVALAACHSDQKSGDSQAATETGKPLPYFTYHKENLFPGKGSLHRVEDGIELKDGRLLVADQEKGLRLIEKDGSSRPFGKFAAAGFVYNPPKLVASPNGVSLEQDGQHLLISDLGTGKIYRVNIANEDVEMIYQHPYGVNAVHEDKSGAIWFTQSTRSTSINELIKDINIPVPHGAVFRMANLKSKPVMVADSIYFANGLAMDKDEKHLYVAETMMDRVLEYDIDAEHGTAKYSGVACNVISPDNLLIDPDGRLFVASTFSNQVVAVDFKNHSQHIIFNGATPENLKLTNDLIRISHLGMERLKFHGKGLNDPLPGGITGMFFSNDGKTFYITNLGNDMLRYDYK